MHGYLEGYLHMCTCIRAWFAIEQTKPSFASLRAYKIGACMTHVPKASRRPCLSIARHKILQYDVEANSANTQYLTTKQHTGIETETETETET